MISTDTVLVLGVGGSAGVNICRALRQSGRVRKLIGTDLHAHRLEVPDIDTGYVLPRTDNPDRLGMIRGIVETESAGVVYAQADAEVAWLAKHRSVLPCVPLPSDAALQRCSDKLVLSRILDRAGVAVPMSEAFHPLTVEADVSAAIGRGDRAWIRARCGAGSKASLPIANGRQARAWVEWWGWSRGLAPQDFMVCEFLPGDEFAHQSVWRDGMLVASVTRQRLEYIFAEQMPSGQSSTPSRARIVHRPDVNAIAERAVRAINGTPNGVYGVDMKCRADGQPCVTEINAGRFYTTSAFYAAAGANLPAALILPDGDDLKLGVDPIPEGVEWIRTLDAEPVIQ
jgi:carbamoyl-phosphate synthase large subunit